MEAAPVPNPGNSRSELSSNSLPVDVALNVVSYLETADVCSLGSCSRFWRGLCSSDFVWIALYKRRWPALGAGSQPRASEGGGGGGGGGGGECSGDAEALSSPQWRVLYINKHRQIASAVSTVIKFVQQCSQNESLEVGYYLKAVADLGLLELGFEDVQLFLFARKQNVLLNLIGLHYSIFSLAAPPKDVAESLRRCEVSDRQVCVSWFKVGRWFYGFRLPDEHRSREVSLGELAMANEEEVLAVLNRGAVHEVLRVQIKSITASTT
ncbi:uncharacterized protein LOC113463024 isoform X2 [Phoenix dactylifera]|uniref:Uncharacterized protein LOC113463024 isoform X2 n=1 Tax=Phoenix dactylifera TaxID=42345 RepID=A0A8B8J7M4_PHODC|nr:uncharacterized protein LOC113463024 isoform X2 [Phoenix dactylifera]